MKTNFMDQTLKPYHSDSKRRHRVHLFYGFADQLGVPTGKVQYRRFSTFYWPSPAAMENNMKYWRTMWWNGGECRTGGWYSGDRDKMILSFQQHLHFIYQHLYLEGCWYNVHAGGKAGFLITRRALAVCNIGVCVLRWSSSLISWCCNPLITGIWISIRISHMVVRTYQASSHMAISMFLRDLQTENMIFWLIACPRQ